MPQFHLQSNFTAGELSPRLDARTDLAKCANGLSLLKNMTIHPHGGATRRSGSEFIAEVKDSSKETRLIPFVFSTTQTYMLEFGHEYIRFYMDGGQILSGGSAYEIASPFQEDELREIKFVQSADVMYLVHPNHAPRKLSRTGHTAWTLATVSFGASIAAPATLNAALANLTAPGSCAASLSQQAAPTGGAGALSQVSAPSGVSASKVDTSAPSSLAVSLTGSGTTTWYYYQVTAILEDGTETLASSTASAAGPDTLDASNYMALTWSAYSGAVEYRVYRKKNDLFSYIGRCGANAYDDKGEYAPNLSITPPATSTSTTHYYKVTAIDSEGVESLPCSAASVGGPATWSQTSKARITWSAVSGAVEYRIYKEVQGVYGYLGKAQGTQFDDTAEASPNVDVQPPATDTATTHIYRVTAVLLDGTESLACADITVASCPAVLSDTSRITITCDEYSNAIAYYWYKYISESSTYGYIGKSYYRSFVDNGIEPDVGSTPPAVESTTTHTYKVTAVNSKNVESVPSAEFFVSSCPSLLSKTSRVNLSCGAVSGAASYLWYKKSDDVFGFIGESGSNSFTDNGITPSTDRPPNSDGWETKYYKVSAVNAPGEESPACTAASVSAPEDLTSAQYVTLSWSAVTDAVEYRVYREINGVYGYIGRAEGTAFDDEGYSPDPTVTAPTDEAPFSGTGNYPAAVAFFEQRLCVGGTSNYPQTIRGSQSANYESFNTSNPTKDDDAVAFTISADQVNVILWMVPLTSLLIGTVGGEWLMNGGGSQQALTPSSVMVRRQTGYGSADIQPLVVGNSVLFIQRPGRIVRQYSYALESDGYVAKDLIILAEHLTRDYVFTSWAYQASPDSIVWVVRSDGALCGLTYMAEHEVTGWHGHLTDGEYESVAVIPGDEEDEVWVVVKRIVNGSAKRYVERFKPQFRGTDTEDAFFVDSGLSYDGWNATDTYLLTLSGTSWDPGESGVPLTATGHSPFSSSDVGEYFKLRVQNAEDSTVWDTAKVRVDGYVSATEVSVTLKSTVPESLRNASTSHWAKLVGTVSGLDHLEGKEVAVLADGAVQPVKTVASGGFALSSPAAKVHAGLAYDSDLRTLNYEFADKLGSSVGRVKRISRLTLKLYKSLGAKVGKDADSLQTIPFRSSADPLGAPPPLFSGDKAVEFNAGYETEARVHVRQDQPLPLTVLGLVVEGETYSR